jgi:hypothetical protein
LTAIGVFSPSILPGTKDSEKGIREGHALEFPHAVVQVGIRDHHLQKVP